MSGLRSEKWRPTNHVDGGMWDEKKGWILQNCHPHPHFHGVLLCPRYQLPRLKGGGEWRVLRLPHSIAAARAEDIVIVNIF